MFGTKCCVEVVEWNAGGAARCGVERRCVSARELARQTVPAAAVVPMECGITPTILQIIYTRRNWLYVP